MTKKSDIKIEKGIPLIPRGYERYPFKDMNPPAKDGSMDSFLVADLEHFHKVRSAASWYGKRNKMKFLTRLVKEGIRVWRIK